MTPSDRSVSPDKVVARKTNHINASVLPSTFACVLSFPAALVVMLWVKSASGFPLGSPQPDVSDTEPELETCVPSEDFLRTEENICRPVPELLNPDA